MYLVPPQCTPHLLIVILFPFLVFPCSHSTCRLENPEELYESNIFIGDLAMHDFNRSYILAGTQQNPELSLALSQVSDRQYILLYPFLLFLLHHHLLLLLQL